MSADYQHLVPHATKIALYAVMRTRTIFVIINGVVMSRQDALAYDSK